MPTITNDAQLLNLAQVSSDLVTAETLLDNCNPASMHVFNALTTSDAFITKAKHASLIERLELTSSAVDQLRDTATALVKALRDEKRILTMSVGSAINTSAMLDAEDSAHDSKVRPVKKRKTALQPNA